MLYRFGHGARSIWEKAVGTGEVFIAVYKKNIYIYIYIYNLLVLNNKQKKMYDVVKIVKSDNFCIVTLFARHTLFSTQPCHCQQGCGSGNTVVPLTLQRCDWQYSVVTVNRAMLLAT